jgi:uncharacterized membrane protein YhaH (DUF805 family)
MSSLKQCSRCRLDYESCGCYDPVKQDLCSNYVRPIDNSKMFGRWYKITGRIGRLEYALTFLIAVVYYFLASFALGQFITCLHNIGCYENQSMVIIYVLFLFVCVLPSIYLITAAGLKRVHDTHQKWYYATAPLLVFCLNIITIVIAIAGFLYLFVIKGEDGINEHGSNPARPYSEQIKLDN